ncbi:uncharacterized protein EV420DRAFT_1742825 [Desarmillaria tabescens]|uniref:Holliday junction resolvase Gen1 C-terminal domain-containing protein n=1 Tax=Armillaria tabescens TaxID=1929756 RepID=A0AA39NLA1_ARMTA|nr:uncharacterized protein EV420DRAFT_1742825 [Desarmillaria tabescens]KAK0467725.1 hypothetical protein EV420DRAFT_1742825 [Desarmillaria tabescens]
MVSLAKSVPESFSDIDILLAYTHPVTSRSEGKPDYYADISWTRKEPQIPALAGLCEFYFEWGFKESIIKRFRTLIWPGIVLRTLRRYILDDDPEQVFTLFSGDHWQPVPGDGWMKKIHSQREHHSTDETLEYRVEIDPTALVMLAEAGVRGIRRHHDEDRKERPTDPLRLWLPAVVVRQAKPELVEAYEKVTRKDSTSQGQDIRWFFPPAEKSRTAMTLKDSPVANAAITPSAPSTSTKATPSRNTRPFPASLRGGPKS